MAFSHHFTYFLFLFLSTQISLKYVKFSSSSSLSILIVSHFLLLFLLPNKLQVTKREEKVWERITMRLAISDSVANQEFAQFDTEMTFGFDLLESSWAKHFCSKKGNKKQWSIFSAYLCPTTCSLCWLAGWLFCFYSTVHHLWLCK